MSFLPYISYVSICLSVPASPAATVGPRTLIFRMDIGPDGRLLIFWKSRSKAKGQGQKSGKNRNFWLVLLIGWVQAGSRVGSGYFWQLANFCWQPAKIRIYIGESFWWAQHRAKARCKLLFCLLTLVCCENLYITVDNFGELHISYNSDSEKVHVTASILWQQGEYDIWLEKFLQYQELLLKRELKMDKRLNFPIGLCSCALDWGSERYIRENLTITYNLSMYEDTWLNGSHHNLSTFIRGSVPRSNE